MSMGFLEPGTVEVTALLSVRLTGLITIAPLFSDRTVSMRIKAALLILLTVLLLPAALGASTDAVRITPKAIISEATVGLILGLAAAIFVAGAQAAGDLLAIQMGLSGASVLDPTTANRLPVLGQFLGLFATAMIVATGGHLVMLQALASTLEVLPVGGAVDLSNGAYAAVKLGSGIFVLGVRFAAPVVAAIMVGNVSLGIMAKAVPQLNVLMAAFPLHIGVGLITLSITVPLISAFFAGWPGLYEHTVSGALEQLSPLAPPAP